MGGGGPDGGCSCSEPVGNWLCTGSGSTRGISGSTVIAENISERIGTYNWCDAASSQGQLVDGVKALRACDGRRIGETCGSTTKATNGAHYVSGLEIHSMAVGSTWNPVCLGYLRSLYRVVAQQFCGDANALQKQMVVMHVPDGSEILGMEDPSESVSRS